MKAVRWVVVGVALAVVAFGAGCEILNYNDNSGNDNSTTETYVAVSTNANGEVMYGVITNSAGVQ